MQKNTVHTFDYPGAEASTDIATSLVSFIASVPERGFKALMVWQKRYEDRLHLESLSDHIISDMGMTRGDIRRESTKAPWEA